MRKVLLTAVWLLLCGNAVNGQTITSRQAPRRTVTNTITIRRNSGLEVAAPLIVAALAFLSAAASLLVSSISSVRLKEREYRNDYFKKVIEKRLKGIESIEDTTGPLRLYHIVKAPDGSDTLFHAFFILPEKGEAFKQAVAETSQHVIWHSQSTAKAFNDFARKVTNVMKQCKGLGEIEARSIAIAEFKSVSETMNRLHMSIGRDMLNLHKVEAFFHDKLNS
jgi:hypothetical protein